MEITVKQAVDRLCQELKNDPELYYAYQANIAMAFYDEYRKSVKDKTIHEISNDAAKRFLNLLIGMGDNKQIES